MCKNVVLLRPHHLLCIAHFVGNGYDDRFIANMTKVISTLDKDNPLVRLVVGEDSICRACPHNIDGICEQDHKVRRYDASSLSLCGLHEDDELPWYHLLRLAEDRILDAGQLCMVCGDCGWYSLCEEIRSKKSNKKLL